MAAARSTTATARARRPLPAWPPSLARSPKMVDRMVFTVSSRSSMARSTRSMASGCSMNLAAPCSVVPVAKSRWIAMSCRSRAIRSRS